MNRASRSFDRKTRNAVAKASDGGPSLQAWLDRITAIDSALLSDAVEGIWCGREGTARLLLPDTDCVLVVGWHNGRVEFSYIS